MMSPLDNVFREIIEGLTETKKTKEGHLIVVLETVGGYIETAQRMVSVMRKHYKEVSFIVPSHAYSAAQCWYYPAIKSIWITILFWVRLIHNTLI